MLAHDPRPELGRLRLRCRRPIFFGEFRCVHLAVGGQEGHRLYAGYLNLLPAPRVLTDHHVVLADHIRLESRELFALFFTGSRRRSIFLAPDNPAQVVGIHLVAVRTVQGSRLALFGFVKKLAFIHIYPLDPPAARPVRYPTASAAGTAHQMDGGFSGHGSPKVTSVCAAMSSANCGSR